ncbi:Uncharacterised protein [Algoriella xinjiangensis]|uniref:hypothetical protein n=1 Tax=Algoriella xinjiangensis TaxID=684065 RepID=UPI000F636B7C|nr:hypothetical protein [Algoriella xinjiangensis]VDH15473.1 Uncharacterised protein [Algoriella xinjiangensis]
MNFTYNANKKLYKNSISASSEEVLIIDAQNDTIIYNPINPEIYSFNPKKDLNNYEKSLNNPNLNEFPWLLLIIFLSSIGVIIYSYL